MKNAALDRAFESEVHFRKAAPDDLHAVASLLGHLGYPLKSGELRELFLELLNDPHSRLLMAVKDSQIVGFANLRTHPALRLNGYQISIEELVVHPDFRAMGIGRELLALVDVYAQMLGAVRVEVQTNSGRESFKRKFYEKNGFLKTGSALYWKEMRSTQASRPLR